MKITLAESLGGPSPTPLPLVFRFARRIETSNLPPIPYDPASQMSIYGGDTLEMAKKDRSTCTQQSSTNEGVIDSFTFQKADSDRKQDD